MAKLSTSDLEDLVAKLQNDAAGGLNGAVASQRTDLMKRYLGEEYGDEIENRSRIVDTTVRDTIEAIKPEIMDIFMGGDRVVEFNARGQEDIDAAKQESDACNYIFQQGNDGFMILYNWITDALFQRNGYIKRFWDDKKRVTIEEYDDLTPQEAAAIVVELEQTSDHVEVLEQSGGVTEKEDGSQEIEPMYIKIRRTDSDKRYTIVNVPPEELLVHAQWTRVDFKDCPFVAHKRAMTVSDLVAMGFNKAEIDALATYDRKLDSQEAMERFEDTGLYSAEGFDNNNVMREVLIYENYVLADRDGDGIAEQLQIFTGGDDGKILRRNGKLAIEEVTDAPFECMTSLPIPHRHYGLSIADLVKDLQRIKTVLSRQLLDNVVMANNPDTVTDEDRMTENTQQDLEMVGFGRNIRIPGGSASYGVVPVVQTAGQSLQAIQYIDSLQEKRTGVTQFSQGLDANMLNSRTWRGAKMLLTAAQKKILLIARIFAETGFKSLFVNMHRDLSAGPMKELSLKLDNKFVTVNPRTWRHRTDVTISVGLGTGDRDVQVARLEAIYEKQQEGFQAGIIPYDKLYHTLSKMIELSGFKDVANFLPDPIEVEKAMANRQQPPDPNMMMAQVQMQKNQLDAMQASQDAQFKLLQLLLQDDTKRDIAAAQYGVPRATLSRADAMQEPWLPQVQPYQQQPPQMAPQQPPQTAQPQQQMQPPVSPQGPQQ